MRIQNNIMAMNTHRQYTLQNEKVASSAEKLSSGYRINRAADDAAGLAISEKMRSQIRGLNMAARNTQDAASLIQTAEGALQEVHSMLQRMNELADQSATGTNAEFDRTQIAKEFDQLKREINDIAEQTTFNNMKILDGSLSVKGYQRSAATVGLYASDLGTMPETNAVLRTDPQIPNIDAQYEKIEGGKFEDMDIAAADKGKSMRIQMEILPGVTITSGEISGADTTTGTVSKTTIAKAFDGVTFTHDGVKFQITQVGATEEFEITALTMAPVNPGLDGITAATANVTLISTGSLALSTDAPTSGGGIDSSSVAYSTDAGFGEGTAGKRQQTVTIDVDKMFVGDKIIVGDKTYQLVNHLSEVEDPDVVGIVWSDDTATGRSLVTLENAMAGGGTSPTGVTVTAIGDTLQIRQDDNDSDKSISFSHKSNATQGTRIEFDLTKMKDGDKIDITVAGQPYSAVYRDGDTLTDIYRNLGVVASGTQDTIYVKDNSILFKELNATVEFTGVTASVLEYGTMRIQVGALEGEQLNIEVQAMNTAGLGLDDFHINDQDSAGKAITAVRSAIDIVSDQRALLGAMQNRMTYKINNIKVSAENLQAAESRIRDVDIAQEMSTFTKSNILTQAATAMLAQANAAPQNVLSLLQ